MLVCAVLPPDVLARTQADLALYVRDGSLAASGALPYRDFPFEYPPLALLPMALPYLLRFGASPTPLEYEWFWAFANATLASIVAALLWWIAARRDSGILPARALLVWAVVCVVEAPVIAWRFDIAAVALAVAGVALVLADRPASAGLVLGLGTLVKLFPAALIPVLVAWLVTRRDLRGSVRLLVAAGATVAAVLAATASLVGPGPAVSFLEYQAERAVQVESVVSSLFLLGHLVLTVPVSIFYGFQSIQVDAPGSELFLAIQTPLTVAAVLLVGAVAFLRFRSAGARQPALVAFLFAAIVILIATNKVFSAQYALWALPFGCLLPRREAMAVVGVALLSVFVYPLGYRELMELQPLAILTLAVRNGLLLVLLGWALVRYRPVRLPGSPVRPGSRLAGV